MLSFRSSSHAIPSAAQAPARETLHLRSRLRPHMADLLISASLTITAAIVPVTSARAATPRSQLLRRM